MNLRRLAQVISVLGFVLCIFGAKLWLIDFAGSDVPTWDQWDAEAESTLRPWLNGSLSAQDILHPHNEHRLVLTKLYALALFVLNDQWDAHLATVVNASFHTGCALLLLQFGRGFLLGAWKYSYAALLILLFSLPYSPDNTLVAFQIQFYFLVFFSVLHLWLTLESDRWSWRWGLGQLCAILTLGTMASGFFSSAAVCGVLTWRLLRERYWTRQQVATFALAITIMAIGWFTRTEVPGHAVFRAQSLGLFFQNLLQLLAWPATAIFPWGIALALPGFFFAARALRRRSLPGPERVLLALLLWILLQCVALAFARGGFGTNSALTNRYFDVLALNVAVGFILVVRLFSGRIRAVAAVVWIALAGGGLVQQSIVMWHTNIVPTAARNERREEHVRAYLRTGDSAHLLNPAPGEVPYPDGGVLLQRLVPAIQDVMPPSVRRPLAIVDSKSTPSLPANLTAPDRRIWSTWSANADQPAILWRSAPQSPHALPVLQFRIAGDLGSRGHDLSLVVKSAAGEAAVIPDTAPGSRWKTIHVFRPAGEWWIEARDADPDGWFAFTEPVEVGRWTWGANKLLKHHALVLACGGVLIVAGGLLGLTPQLRHVA